MAFTTKDLENVLVNKSVVLNDGAFLLRVSKADVDQSDFLKQCLYGDAFPSAYSQNVSMIPTGIFLPQLISGKNVFLEHVVCNTNVPLPDNFTPHAFLIHESGHRQVKEMYNKVLTKRDNLTYSTLYDKVLESVRCHEQTLKRTVDQDNDLEILRDTTPDEETESYLAENSEFFTVMFVTQTASVRLQLDDNSRLSFGNVDSNLHVSLANSIVASFDGITDDDKQCNISFSKRVTKAIKRELLTMTQLYAGYCKQPSQDTREYLQNISCLFSHQVKGVVCHEEENVESYSVSALKIWMSNNVEVDDINTSWSILGDSNYEDTIREKILFQLVMVLEKGSCFNSRELCRREISEGKPSIICSSTYTNPSNELKKAVYGNMSMFVHLVTECAFFNKVKLRVSCETCQQKYCAVSIPSMLFKHSPNIRKGKKERSTVVACFNTSNIYNKTGPIGDMRDDNSRATDSFKLDNRIDWEKHHRDLFSFLNDNVNFDLKFVFNDTTPTTEDNIDERAEKVMEWLSNQLDNVVQLSEQFCRELDDGAESVARTASVEADMKNVYSVPNMYNQGFTAMLLSESLLYFLRCIVLYEQRSFKQVTASDVFMKVLPLLLDNKSGFQVKRFKDLKPMIMDKLAISSYNVGRLRYDIENRLSESYSQSEILCNVSYKCKVYLFGRYNEKKKNGNKQNQPMLQNMSSRKTNNASTTSSIVGNNSFMHFKNFCSNQAGEALCLDNDDDYCRQILNQYRDDILWEYAPLFKYVKEYRIESWTEFAYLVSVVKLLEHLKIQPSYDKITFMTFNRLSRNGQQGEWSFKDDKIGDEFSKMSTVYGLNSTVVEFTSETHNNAVVRKCTGRFLEMQNDLLNEFSFSKMYPGCPIYYLPLGEKSFRSSGSNNDFMTKFINEDQFLQEKDALFTSYIVRHRKQFYDCLFETTFSDQGKYIEDRLNQDILDEMLTSFDENYPVSVFVKAQIHSFLRLVLSEYLNPDQSVVQVQAKRIKEINARVKNRMNTKRKQLCEDEETCSSESGDQQATLNTFENDEDDDAENQFLRKRKRLE